MTTIYKKQEKLSSFNQLFLVGFFVCFCGFVLPFVSGFGRPLITSFIASKSASVNTPAEPTNSAAFLFARWSRLFTATDDIPKIKAIFCTVYSFSIYNSLYHFLALNQWENSKMSKLLDILLYSRIVKNQKIFKISENSAPNLDYLIGRVYSIYISVQTLIQIKDGFRRHREPKWRKAEGDLYEERRTFQRCVCE
jgi:hypothetical protein